MTTCFITQNTEIFVNNNRENFRSFIAYFNGAALLCRLSKFQRFCSFQVDQIILSSVSIKRPLFPISQSPYSISSFQKIYKNSCIPKSAQCRSTQDWILHVILLGRFHPFTGHEGPQGEQRYSSTPFQTSALEGVRGQRHAPAAPYPRERPGIHCTGGWVGLRAGLDM